MALIILTSIYYFILLILLVYSSLQKLKGISNDFLYIFFLVNFLVECFIFYNGSFLKKNVSGIYFLLDILNIIYTYFYFTMYFEKQKYLSILTFFSVLSIFILNEFNISEYTDKCAIISCFYVIICCLLGFYYIIEKISYLGKKIQDIPFFWFGTAMLLWNVMFLLRTIPRFYFQNEDGNFMESLRVFFAVINIITYLLFFYLLIKYHKNANNIIF